MKNCEVLPVSIVFSTVGHVDITLDDQQDRVAEALAIVKASLRAAVEAAEVHHSRSMQSTATGFVINERGRSVEADAHPILAKNLLQAFVEQGVVVKKAELIHL
jgi:hypothetical protein